MSANLYEVLSNLHAKFSKNGFVKYEKLIFGQPVVLFSYAHNAAFYGNNKKDYTPEEFEMLREMRGIVFDTQERILRRPFQKFFNFGENEYSSEEYLRNITTRKNLVMYKRTKEDGSMIAPIVVDDQIYWGSRELSLDYHEAVSKYVNSLSQEVREGLVAFVKECAQKNKTPLFEYVGPQNRIVVEYKEEKLLFLSLRCNLFGDYYFYDGVKDPNKESSLCYNRITAMRHINHLAPFASNSEWIILEPNHKGEMVPDSSFKSFFDFFKEEDEKNGKEGSVYYFLHPAGGFSEMVKVKTETYLLYHRAVGSLMFAKDREKAFLEVFFHQSETIDDTFSSLPGDIAENLRNFLFDIFTEYNSLYTKLQKIHQEILDRHKESENLRRDYMLDVTTNHNKDFLRMFVSFFDNKDVSNLEKFMKSCFKGFDSFHAWCDKYLLPNERTTENQ